MIPDPDQMNAYISALNDFNGILRQLVGLFADLQKGQQTIMAAIDDLKAAEAQETTDLGQLVITINTAVTSLQSAASTERQLIATLKAEIAASGAAVDLTPLIAAAQARDATITGLVASVTAAAANLTAPPAA
jgi:hypothetical protein